MTVAPVVPMKGADMEWVTEQAARDLLRFGIHGDVILKSDQQPAIVDVLEEIAKNDAGGLSLWRLEVPRCGGESHPEHGEVD